MINIVFKTPVLRYGLIFLLIIFLFTSTGYLAVRYTDAQTVQNNIDRLVTVKSNSDLIDSCIQQLTTAEADSRYFWLTGDTVYLSRFSTKLKASSQLLKELDRPPFKIGNLLNNHKPEKIAYSDLLLLSGNLADLPGNLQNLFAANRSNQTLQSTASTDSALQAAGIMNIPILVSSLRSFKRIEQGRIHESKTVLKGTISTVFSEFSRVSLFALLILTALIGTLLYNIWKIFRNEKNLLRYSEKANAYADAKSSFLASMSHEIRTPLNSIIGFAEQLDQHQLPAEQAEQVKAIRNSSVMLLEVVNQILDFSKYETGKMNINQAPFNIHELVKEVLTSMSMMAESKSISLQSDFSFDDKFCLIGDAFRLKQVLVNLLSNAIKFTPRGTVTLRILTEDDDIDILYLKAEVIDTGVGIDEAHLPLIFNEFSQVGSAQKENYKGTGLGLAICKKIVELQGGSIHVESTPDEGSVFSFTIPYLKIQTENFQTNTEVYVLNINERLQNKHILLAEDNSMNILLAKTILKKWKMTCDIAMNGLEALKLFQQNTYDLILTDIEMPEMDGVELVKHIRQIPDQRKALIPVLAITANVMKEDHDNYRDAGINDIAMKPFLEKELVEKIAATLEKCSETPGS